MCCKIPFTNHVYSLSTSNNKPLQHSVLLKGLSLHKSLKQHFLLIRSIHDWACKNRACGLAKCDYFFKFSSPITFYSYMTRMA